MEKQIKYFEFKGDRFYPKKLKYRTEGSSTVNLIIGEGIANRLVTIDGEIVGTFHKYNLHDKRITYICNDGEFRCVKTK